MGWDTSDRRERLPKNWSTLRTKVLRRDGYLCKADECSMPANQVDHIVAGDDHSLANLQALCEKHHRQKTSKEGHEAQTKFRFLPQPKHPGFL